MSYFLPFVIAGIATGAIYGLAASGLLLTFKTSGIFNFGHGALATIAAYLFYFLHYVHNVEWLLAFVISVGVAGPVLGLLMERIAGKLSLRSTVLQVVGTIGIILIVEGLATIIYGPDTINVAQYLPNGNSTVYLGGVYITYAQIVVTSIAVVLVATLYGVLRWTHIGTATRAVVDDRDLVALLGTNPSTIGRLSWIIGCTFAAVSGVLILPFIGLSATGLTLLVVEAFGAAAVGSFTSLPLTFLGGLGIGIVASIAQKYVLSTAWLAGVPVALPVLILFVLLVFLPPRRFRRREAPKLSAPRTRASPSLQVVAALCVGTALVLVPVLVGSQYLGYYTVGLTQAIIILSLGLLVRTAGQVSLCQVTFAAIGVVVFSQLTVQDHVPWFLALLLAGATAIPVGALVAIPALRLSGVFLALATFGVGIAVQELLYGEGFMFTASASGRPVPRPVFASSDISYYYLVLALFVVFAIIGVIVQQSRLGRLLKGLGEAPIAIGTLGLSANVTRVVVFSLAAFMAAIGGVLYGGSIHYALASDTNFQPFESLTLLAILALAPFELPWYALVGGIAAVIPGYFSGGNTANWLNVLFGASAISIAYMGGQPAMPERVRKLLRRSDTHESQESVFPRDLVPASTVQKDAEEQPRSPADVQLDSGLEVESLTIRYRGLLAVDALSFTAPLGSITGLIGPNGAGKTSAFDACSGLNTRVEGRMRLCGAELTNLSPSERARRGLGRTFQRVYLADSLSVYENVALGREAGLAGGGVVSQLLATRSQHRAARDATEKALSDCGITHLRRLQAGTLSTGQRRLVELARCLAGEFKMLLLDEPSSGLDEAETANFAAIVNEAVRKRGVGVLLIEHDLALVADLCQKIYVLDAGCLIFMGSPAAALDSPEVQAAYLGRTEMVV